MRRVLPWALVAMLVVVGAGAALVGLEGQSTTAAPVPFTRQLIAATRAARTARFTYSSVSYSSNPRLRNSEVGEGSVDFASRSISTSERDGPIPATADEPSRTNRQIWIGRTTYLRLKISGSPDSAVWIKSATFPPGSFGSLGALGTVAAVGELVTDATVEGLSLQSLGSETIHGVPTTRYLLVRPWCRSGAGASTTAVSPTEVWVDSQYRLVQARSLIRFTIPQGDSPGPDASLAGRTTTVSTIRLFDFGAPVSITAPRTIYRTPGSQAHIVLRTSSSCPQ